MGEDVPKMSRPMPHTQLRTQPDVQLALRQPPVQLKPLDLGHGLNQGNCTHNYGNDCEDCCGQTYAIAQSLKL